VGWKVSFVKNISSAPFHVFQSDASFLLSCMSSTLQSLHPSLYCGKADLIVEESGSENIENMRVYYCGNCGDVCVILPTIFVVNVMELQEDKHNDKSE
jgi:hypothetical protein